MPWSIVPINSLSYVSVVFNEDVQKEVLLSYIHEANVQEKQQNNEKYFEFLRSIHYKQMKNYFFNTKEKICTYTCA
jgi:hypothetical protein